MAAPRTVQIYISVTRGKTGKKTGDYIPHHVEAQIREGVDAWSQLQDRLRELAALNKERLSPTKTKK
jgi:nucleoid-associated protein YejK